MTRAEQRMLLSEFFEMAGAGGELASCAARGASPSGREVELCVRVVWARASTESPEVREGARVFARACALASVEDEAFWEVAFDNCRRYLRSLGRAESGSFLGRVLDWGCVHDHSTARYVLLATNAIAGAHLPGLARCVGLAVGAAYVRSKQERAAVTEVVQELVGLRTYQGCLCK